jgi:hypothetical protein
MVPSESAQELSNEWSCQYVSTILNFSGNFCVPPLPAEVAKGHTATSVTKGHRNWLNNFKLSKHTDMTHSLESSRGALSDGTCTIRFLLPTPFSENAF